MSSKVYAKYFEQGSIFILVLMVLVIVTFVGLSLIFVTETEMQLGGTDKVITNTFFAAESGIHAAVGGIPHQNWAGEKIALVEGPLGPNRLIGTRVLTSRVHAVGNPQLPPMSLANEGEIDYFTFSVAFNTVAQRVAWPNTEAVPIYEDGDLREQSVTIQSERILNIRMFLSPLRRPAAGEELYNETTRLDL